MSTVVRLLLFLMIFALTAFFNIVEIDLRFSEIQYLLGTLAEKDKVSNTFGIVARYELIKRRMMYGEENNQNYELEARIQALTSGGITDNVQKKGRFKYARVPVKYMLNGIRFFLGKPIVNTKEEDQIYSVLEIGYFYERIRKYNEALKYYEEILETGQLTPDIRAAILVHKSFCMSMIGRYDVAKKVYEQVINTYPETEAGILSWKLLEFLNSMDNERNKLESKRLSTINKAKQFYLYMDFRNAIKNYSLYIGDNRGSKNVAEARFYKGRSHEELGETEDAVMEYRAVIRMDKTKIWARQANRRMLMLGEFYTQQKSIADEARKKLELYQDQVFASNVQKYSSLVSATTLKGELSQNGTENKHNDSILNMIDNIGSISDEKDQDISDPTTAPSQTINSESTLSKAEIKELKRKKLLAENPFRRPSMLKKSIDEYSVELRYIYNRHLRKGMRLSGNMVVAISILPDGRVGNAELLRSNITDDDFEKAIAARIKKWKFKSVPDSLGVLTIHYPFEFYQEQ